MKHILRCMPLLVLLVLFSIKSMAKLQGQRFVDSMLKELPRQNEDTNKVKFLRELAAKILSISPIEATKYCQQSVDLAVKLDWKKGIAAGYNVLGNVYLVRSEYPKVLEFYFKALQIDEEIGNKKGVTAVTCNIGNLYITLEDEKKALDYLLKGLKLAEEGNYKTFAAKAIHNIGGIYARQDDYPTALDYLFRALKLNQELGNLQSVGISYQTIGDVYSKQKRYTLGALFTHRSLEIAEQLEYKFEIAKTLHILGKIYLEKAKSESIAGGGSVSGADSEDSSHTEQARAIQSTFRIPKGKAALLAAAIDYEKRALTLCKDLGIRNLMIYCYLYISEAYALKGDYKLAMEYQTAHHAIKDSVFSEDNKAQLVKLEMQDQFERQRLVDSLKVAERERLSALQLRKQKSYSAMGMAGILLLAFFSFFIVRERGKSERERKKSDALLLNILPAEVAQELKSNGSSEAKDFDNVTVLFTDFVNFTRAGEKMSAKSLVGELHACFKAFDDITNKYGIEKIKTIGDAYLAVAGLPSADPKHAKNAVIAAIEISTFMQKRQSELGRDNTFEIRIGIHSGSVVAGIVGIKKFAYDIWGDTVNTAARLEQNCEAGKINISETTYGLVKGEIDCIFRGEIEAKGKGQLKMYYVGQK